MTASIRVACALIIEKGCLFAARRGAGRRNEGLWELPGGKLEAGETARACIIRELREELGLDVEPLVEWEPVRHTEPGLTLTLIPLICRRVGGSLILTEHTETGWFDAKALAALKWSEADIPVIERWRAEAAKESRP